MASVFHCGVGSDGEKIQKHSDNHLSVPCCCLYCCICCCLCVTELIDQSTETCLDVTQSIIHMLSNILVGHCNTFFYWMNNLLQFSDRLPQCSNEFQALIPVDSVRFTCKNKVLNVKRMCWSYLESLSFHRSEAEHLIHGWKNKKTET